MSQASYLRIYGWTLGAVIATFLDVVTVIDDGWTAKSKGGSVLVLVVWIGCVLNVWHTLRDERLQTPKRRLDELTNTLLGPKNRYTFVDTPTGRSIEVRRTPRFFLVFAVRYHIWISSDEEVFDDDSSEMHKLVETTHFILPRGAVARVSKIVWFFRFNTAGQIIAETTTMPEKLTLRNLAREAEFTLASQEDIRELHGILEAHLNEQD